MLQNETKLNQNEAFCVCHTQTARLAGKRRGYSQAYLLAAS